ncbi:zf-CCHC domain-containing protein/rve domain-containing protein/RVT_2 domain-containing protein/gag_pre-integrs domain-containing protein/UBN2_2 domain-containing protein [Senna tora]|uniref:Zf-CCHC domain-containing protein/rve domain-containing protein/RVT_2 domain-containing protein/gag_pre-integrs domain-containing protein/UBN2_2 domain-containing protein n=1 Tax=Senna tora TaxID=362788 RepID=A0A834T2V0_9FABA|nr:zf-CCHC domain-containing protein/rve domain-containing protein/RVT_2 domain-containing protein/gag_pre-integrs domain-containing protein/UBN2_2 domain-containing protein [Senna tora]
MTIPGTPQQNGVAERRNRTLLDMIRSMMAQANLPISYWGNVLLTATFILNRVPSTSVASTPYELWTKRKPDLSILRPWGSAAYIHDNSHKYGKLGPRGKKCIFIRYSEQSKGYVFIDLGCRPATGATPTPVLHRRSASSSSDLHSSHPHESRPHTTRRSNFTVGSVPPSL